MSTYPVAVGDVLAGKYRVETIIGKGGMGFVVAAMHLQLHESVALKFLLPQAANEPEYAARFEREARMMAKLRSEHVVRVIDVDKLESGAPFMVMELLDGTDLRDIIREVRQVPLDVALDYFLQACEGVAEAHAQGIVHRDLKPTNIFVTQRRDGSTLVKVLDFGISKLQSDGDEDDQLTGAATILGSPRYMPPEQLRSSRNVDHRADVWALGAILQELL
ncbi:MAG: serine/threonine protein kinase, partial [Myxococcales bacterium]